MSTQAPLGQAEQATRASLTFRARLGPAALGGLAQRGMVGLTSGCHATAPEDAAENVHRMVVAAHLPALKGRHER
jgi:hypothetical protein